MRRKPRNIPCVADFNPDMPSIARVYDYFNGGRGNFAADRALAQRLIEVFPPIPETIRDNKLTGRLARSAHAGPCARLRLGTG
jgi:S-adenosyl methyltransferase